MSLILKDKLPITVLIAAKNEAPNLPKCFDSLKLVEKVFVIDSYSSDSTVEIAISYGAEVVQFHYKGGYPKKRQWALDNLDIKTPWVFLIDADEVVPDMLWDEIKTIISEKDNADAYMIKKGFHFLGKKMKFGGFSFDAVLLFKAGKAKFERLVEDDLTGFDIEVHERIIVQGRIGKLKIPLIHEDFKNLEAYISRHNIYSTWKAKVRYQLLMSGGYGKETISPRLFGNSQERHRWLDRMVYRLPFEHWVFFFYHYFFRLGFLEGYRGLIACQIRSDYVAQVRAKVYELQKKKLSDN